MNENGDILFKNKDNTYTFNDYSGSIVESSDLHIWNLEQKRPPSCSSDKSMNNI